MYSDGPSLRVAGRSGGAVAARAVDGRAAGELVVRLVATDGALHRLLPEWWGLWERAGASPFASPAWALGWWRLAEAADLFCLAVRRHGELVALAPLRRTAGPAGNHLGFLASGPGERDLLVDPSAVPGCLVALGDALNGYAELWDSLTLDGLPSDGFALRLPVTRGQGDRVAASGQHRLLPAVEPDPLPTGTPVDLDDSTVMRLVDALGDGEPSVEDLRPFLLHALPALRAAGLADLSGVAVDGRIRAAQFGVFGRDRYHLVRTGGDPHLALREAQRRARAAGRSLIVVEDAAVDPGEAGLTLRRLERVVTSGL